MSSIVLVTALCAISSAVTIWRLAYRALTRKLWWDDAWAGFAMLASIVFVPTNWIVFDPEDHVSLHVSSTARMVLFYILEVSFTFTLWFARLSILWTIIRITPPNQSSSSSAIPSKTNRYAAMILDFQINRRLLYVMAVLFCTFTLILTAQKFWVCVGQTKPIDWVHTPGAFCSLGRQVSILEIVSKSKIIYLQPLSRTRLTDFLHRNSGRYRRHHSRPHPAPSSLVSPPLSPEVTYTPHHRVWDEYCLHNRLSLPKLLPNSFWIGRCEGCYCFMRRGEYSTYYTHFVI